MKTMRILSIILIAGSGYSAQGQHLSAKQQSVLESEIDSLFSITLTAAEKLDAESLAQAVDDTHEAGFIAGNIYYTRFDSLMSAFREGARGVPNQQITVDTKKITLLSGSIGLLTATGIAKANIRGVVVTTKFFWSFVFEKTDNRWKVIQSHQSGVRL